MPLISDVVHEAGVAGRSEGGVADVATPQGSVSVKDRGTSHIGAKV